MCCLSCSPLNGGSAVIRLLDGGPGILNVRSAALPACDRAGDVSKPSRTRRRRAALPGCTALARVPSSNQPRPGDAVVRGEPGDQTGQESRSAGHRAAASITSVVPTHQRKQGVNAHVSSILLGVRDMDRSKRFYTEGSAGRSSTTTASGCSRRRRRGELHGQRGRRGGELVPPAVSDLATATAVDAAVPGVAPHTDGSDAVGVEAAGRQVGVTNLVNRPHGRTRQAPVAGTMIGRQRREHA
jgi:hypothetical protein